MTRALIHLVSKSWFSNYDEPFAVDVRCGACGQWTPIRLAWRELLPGESIDTVLRLRVPRANALHPYLVVAPLREVSDVRVSVDFGPMTAASTCWILDGVLPSDLGPSGTMPAGIDPLPALGLITRRFRAPRIGLAYGVAWRPAD